MGSEIGEFKIPAPGDSIRQNKVKMGTVTEAIDEMTKRAAESGVTLQETPNGSSKQYGSIYTLKDTKGKIVEQLTINKYANNKTSATLFKHGEIRYDNDGDGKFETLHQGMTFYNNESKPSMMHVQVIAVDHNGDGFVDGSEIEDEAQPATSIIDYTF